MCRTPEIAPLRTAKVWRLVNDIPTEVDHTVYQCVNCDRFAHECPLCKALRCDSDLHMSMVGSFPLACKVCRPAGIEQVFQMGAGPGAGPYRAGWRLIVDDPEVDGFTIV